MSLSEKEIFNSNFRRLLRNALIQPYFDYACSAWYPNLTKKLKNRVPDLSEQTQRFLPAIR